MSTIFETVPLNPIAERIQSVLAKPDVSADQLEQAVSDLVNRIATSKNPSEGLWQLWDAFFITIAKSPGPYDAHFALLRIFRAQPPIKLTPGAYQERMLRPFLGNTEGMVRWSELPRFFFDWRDAYNLFWDRCSMASTTSGWRLYVAPNGLPYEYYRNFTTFTTAFINTDTGGPQEEKDSLSEWVFVMSKMMLERHFSDPRSATVHNVNVPVEQLRTAMWQAASWDVLIAALWLRDAGPLFWVQDMAKVRKFWHRAMDEETEMWPRTNGVTRDRWQMWANRLRELMAEEGRLDEETREVAAQAVEVVQGLLDEGVGGEA